MSWFVVLFLLAAGSAFAADAGESSLAPVSAPGDLQEQTALIELDGTASESPDGGKLTYQWRQIEGPKVELSDPTSAKPYFRTGKAGFYRFELVVTANGLASDPFYVDLEIERQNLPPVAVLPPEIFGEVGKKIEIDGGESYDPEGKPLTYRWRSLTRGLALPTPGANDSVLSFEPTLDGVFEVELVVSDGETASPPAIVRVAVKPKPRPPVARGTIVALKVPTAPQPEMTMAPPAGALPVANIKGPTVAQIGDTVMLDARGSSGSGANRLEYLWRQKSGPFISDFELVFDGAAERFKPPREGDYEFELIVSDGKIESRPIVHTLRVVKEPDPPVAVVVAPARANPGDLVKMDATQSYDMAGSPLVYRWRQTGGPKVTNYVIDEKIGDASPGFRPPNAGIYSFELVVSNGKQQSKPVEIDIAVGNVRRPPKFNFGGPEVANIGENIEMTVAADQPNLSFAWRQADGPAQLLTQTVGGPRLPLAPPVPGRYVFEVAAVEGGKIVGTDRRTLEVFGVPASQPRPGIVKPNPSATVLPAGTRQAVPVAAAQPVAPSASATISAHPTAPVQAVPTAPLRPLEPISAPPATGELTPLVDMPPTSGNPRPAAPAPVAPGSGRPAAQIHPSSLSGGLYDFSAPPPLEPLPELQDLH